MVGTAANKASAALALIERPPTIKIKCHRDHSEAQDAVGKHTGPPLTDGEVSRASRDLGEDESWVVAGVGPVLV